MTPNDTPDPNPAWTQLMQGLRNIDSIQALKAGDTIQIHAGQNTMPETFIVASDPVPDPDGHGYAVDLRLALPPAASAATTAELTRLCLPHHPSTDRPDLAVPPDASEEPHP